MANPHLPVRTGSRAQNARRTETAERRGAERVSLTLAAELIEIPAGARITGRMSDCCMFGCFVDTLNTFPDRTPVRLRLLKGHQMFEAEAVVAYSQVRLGMGLAFTYISQENRRLLEFWIAHGTEQPIHGIAAAAPAPENLAAADPTRRFEKLVRMLNEKGVLKDVEARELLGSNIV